jgi:hypothetical protein
MQFHCRHVRAEARAAALEAARRGEIADHHRFAAGIANELRSKRDGLGIVTGDWNAELAALPAGRRGDGRRVDGAEGAR